MGYNVTVCFHFWAGREFVHITDATVARFNEQREMRANTNYPVEVDLVNVADGSGGVKSYASLRHARENVPDFDSVWNSLTA